MPHLRHVEETGFEKTATKTPFVRTRDLRSHRADASISLISPRTRVYYSQPRSSRMQRLCSRTRGMDHAPARGGERRRPHWWVGIGGRRALLLLRACWWYGQRKRLVQVQAKVVAGPGGGGSDMLLLLLHTCIPTYHYFLTIILVVGVVVSGLHAPR